MFWRQFGKQEHQIKIMIVEDDQMTRDFLKTRLALEKDFRVVASPATAMAAMESLRSTEVNIVVLDHALGGAVTGMQLLSYVTQGGTCAGSIRPRVLFCTGLATLEFEREALKNGAAGVVGKGEVAQDLVPVIRKTMDGGAWFPLMEAEKQAARRRAFPSDVAGRDPVPDPANSSGPAPTDPKPVE